MNDSANNPYTYYFIVIGLLTLLISAIFVVTTLVVGQMIKNSPQKAFSRKKMVLFVVLLLVSSFAVTMFVVVFGPNNKRDLVNHIANETIGDADQFVNEAIETELIEIEKQIRADKVTGFTTIDIDASPRAIENFHRSAYFLYRSNPDSVSERYLLVGEWYGDDIFEVRYGNKQTIEAYIKSYGKDLDINKNQ